MGGTGLSFELDSFTPAGMCNDALVCFVLFFFSIFPFFIKVFFLTLLTVMLNLTLCSAVLFDMLHNTFLCVAPPKNEVCIRFSSKHDNVFVWCEWGLQITIVFACSFHWVCFAWLSSAQHTWCERMGTLFKGCNSENAIPMTHPLIAFLASGDAMHVTQCGPCVGVWPLQDQCIEVLTDYQICWSPIQTFNSLVSSMVGFSWRAFDVFTVALWYKHNFSFQCIHTEWRQISANETSQTEKRFENF